MSEGKGEARKRVHTLVERVKVLVVEKGDAEDVARAFASAEEAQKRICRLRRRWKQAEEKLVEVQEENEVLRQELEAARSGLSSLRRAVAEGYALIINSRRQLRSYSAGNYFTEAELRIHAQPDGKVLAEVVVAHRAGFNGFNAAREFWPDGVTTKPVSILTFLRIQEQQLHGQPISINLAAEATPAPVEVQEAQRRVTPAVLEEQVKRLAVEVESFMKRAGNALREAEGKSEQLLHVEKRLAAEREGSSRQWAERGRVERAHREEMDRLRVKYEEAVRYVKTLRESQHLSTGMLRQALRGLRGGRCYQSSIAMAGEALFLARGGRRGEASLVAPSGGEP